MSTTAPEGRKHWPRRLSEAGFLTLELRQKSGAGHSTLNSHYPWSRSGEDVRGTVEVHDAGKPAERFFCFLVLGALNDPNQSYDQRYNPWINMNGIGMDPAYRIWHRGLTVYCGANTNYLGWLYAMAHSAKDLYGNPSAELTAVREAAKAINMNIDGYNP